MQKPLHYFGMLCSILSLSALSACSFISPILGSESVVISYDTSNCKATGETTVQVLSKVIGIERSEETIADELNTLARNAAYEQGANTISPTGEITDGRRRYKLYRCPN